MEDVSNLCYFSIRVSSLTCSPVKNIAALHKHDGPYAAATASRNKGPRAPMGAFDPSALAPPTSVRTPRSNSNLSPRAAATLAAMDSEGMGMRGDSPYGAASGSRNGAHGRPGMGRRASESSITMGFPSTQVSGKGQALIEIYGVR